MTSSRSLFARYLRQQKDLGLRELHLESLSAQEALLLLSGRRSASAGAGAGASASAGASGGASGEVGVRVTASPAQAQLAVIASEIAACTGCKLHAGRANPVPGVGSATASVMVVGEAPGAEEDRRGEPFVGPAGKYLDLMLLSVGLPRDEVFIANTLKCRPPGNRDPQTDEVASCATFLRRQVETIAPRAILAVGKFAAQTLSGKELPIGRLRGQIHSYLGIPVIATFHPAFLLRSPAQVRGAWQDLQLLRQVLDGQV